MRIWWSSLPLFLYYLHCAPCFHNVTLCWVLKSIMDMYDVHVIMCTLSFFTLLFQIYTCFCDLFPFFWYTHVALYKLIILCQNLSTSQTCYQHATIAPTIKNNIWMFLTMLSTKQDIHDFWISLINRKYPPTCSIN
jgi:hypothetical protein